MKTHLVYFVLAQFQPKSATSQPSFYTKCIHVTLLNTIVQKTKPLGWPSRTSSSSHLDYSHASYCCTIVYLLFQLHTMVVVNFFLIFLVNLVPVVPFTIFVFVRVLKINQFKPYWKRTDMVLRSY